MSLGPLQWKEIKLLWAGRGCCVHMCCEGRHEGAGGLSDLDAIIQPHVPLPGEPPCQDGPGRMWDEHPAERPCAPSPCVGQMLTALLGTCKGSLQFPGETRAAQRFL